MTAMTASSLPQHSWQRLNPYCHLPSPPIEGGGMAVTVTPGIDTTGMSEGGSMVGGRASHHLISGGEHRGSLRPPCHVKGNSTKRRY